MRELNERANEIIVPLSFVCGWLTARIDWPIVWDAFTHIRTENPESLNWLGRMIQRIAGGPK